MKKSPLTLLFLTIFIDLLGFGIVIPILPNYIKVLTGNDYWVGITVAVFSLMQFFATPLLGGLSDRYGRRPVLLITLAVNVAGYLMLSQASTLIFLLSARALNGFASGNISVAQAYIIDVTPPEKRAKAMGLIGAAFGMGFIFGPPAGGLIMANFGFEWVGYFAAMLCALNLVPAFLFLKESLHEKNLDSPIRVVPVKDYQKAFKVPVVRQLFFINFFYITAFFLFQVCSTLFWDEHFGLNAKERGYTFAFLGVCTAIVQILLVGIMSKKIGDNKLMIGCNIAMGMIIICLGLVPRDGFIPWELMLIFFMALANGPVGPSSLSILSQNSNKREQGKIVGLYQSFSSLARVTGPLVGTSLYAESYLYPFIAGGVLMFLNAFLAARLVQELKKPKAHMGVVENMEQVL
jgi:DHA1 family tetracycline resistance protein-like MFS transporter